MGGRFFLDKASGLYKPETYKQEYGSEKDAEKCKSVSPFPVRVTTDLLVLAVSVITLVLLGFTVYYAAHQWQEMIRAANGTTNLANAAWVSAETAADALEDNRESLRTTLRQMEIQSWSQLQSANAAVRASRAASRQVGAMQKLAVQAQRSADTAAASLILANRPWVGTSGDVTITGPLFSSTPFEWNVIFPLEYSAKNFGSSAAINEWDIWGVVTSDDLGRPPRDDEFLKIPDCTKMEGGVTPTPSSPLQLLLPGQDSPGKMTILGVPQPRNRVITHIEEFWIVGCVIYEDINSTRHSTRIIYHSIPNENLPLIPFPFPFTNLGYRPIAKWEKWGEMAH